MNPTQKQRLAACRLLARRIVERHRADAPSDCDPQMSFAIVAVAGATVVAAGVGAYASSSAASTQADALKEASKRPPLVEYVPPDPSAGITAYGKLSAGANDAFKQASANDATANAYYQQVVGATDPRLTQGITDSAANTAKIQDITSSYLNGQLTGDTRNQVGSSSAYRALQGGFGANANQAQTRGLSARDLGTTTQALQLTGVGLANTVSQRDQQAAVFSQALNPNITRSSDILPTPKELLAREDNNAAFANQQANYNSNISYQNAITAAQANGINPGLAGLSSLAGSFSSPAVQSGVKQIAGAAGNYFSGSSNPYGGGNYDPNQFSSSTYQSYGGSYNPYLDQASYNTAGEFVANPYSFGG